MSFLINRPGGLAAIRSFPLLEKLFSVWPLLMSFVGYIVILLRIAIVFFINKANCAIYDDVVLLDIIEKR
jgi:hypothetical protein